MSLYESAMKEKKVRQLSAIMFTDIVGYTALMQGDEEIASNVRRRHREVFEKQHDQFNGEIIQYYGDGTLSVFKSAIEAIKCAIDIQRLMQEGDPVPIRIGLHLGDIVFNNTEVYGDGVNFASRIENMGVGGAILLSEKFNDELKNHSSISTSSLGYFELKNIAKPVEVYAVTNKGIIVPQLSDLKVKQKATNKTIAVLPFVNMSTSEENEYFSDGITEEIINALAKIKSLKVTSRTSSFFFKNKKIPIKQIGKDLNVSAILEGSVRLSGNTIRITAQLIQAEEDFHFWSETWDRKLENIFDIQDEISLLIADKLREYYGHFEIQEHLVEKQTDSIDAYEYSLKAIYHTNKWNLEDMKLAISLFEKALELDPNHTSSLVGLADSYSFMAMTGFMSFDEAWGKSTQLINKALSLDEHLPGAYYQLANHSLFTACDYKKSIEQITKAISINPNYVKAQQFMAFLYVIADNHEKAKHHLEIALTIDPLSQETLFYKGYLDYMMGNYSESLKQFDQCLEVNPKNIPAISVKSICLLKLGQYDEVISYFNSLPPEVVILGEKTGTIALAYAFKKDTINTEEYRNRLIEQAGGEDGFTASSYLFLLNAVLGESDKAFEWVEQAMVSKSSLLLLRFSDPLVDPIKNDPRYLEFKRKLYSKFDKEIVKKKKKVLLDQSSVDKYSALLLNYVDKEKPYLDPTLSLRSLADKIAMHPNQLSWLLNESIGKNFSEFINHYRVETFKLISKDDKNSHISLIGLAFDSGFNSKTVFNTYFKKETGLTPNQFLKQ